MRDRILSLNELDNVRRNINMVEGVLGYEVPRYLLNDEELSTGILSLNEVDDIARNIRMIEGTRVPDRKSVANTIVKMCDMFYVVLGAAIIIGMFLMVIGVLH